MTIDRRTFALLLIMQSRPASAGMTLGDEEWMRRFRLFVKAFNEFVEALDDNKLDRGKWKKMRGAWDDLDSD